MQARGTGRKSGTVGTGPTPELWLPHEYHIHHASTNYYAVSHRPPTELQVQLSEQQVTAPSPPPKKVAEEIMSCDKLSSDAAYLNFIVLVFAVGVLAALCLTQRRARLLRGCLWGVPGVVEPVNLLSFSRFRLVYAVIFGAMSSTFLTLAQGGIFSFNAESIPLRLFYRFVLQPLLSALIVSLTFFPLFACVNAPITLIGHILGFIYSILLFATILMRDSIDYMGCSDTENYVVVLTGISAIPLYCCHTFILVWYAYSISRDIWKLCEARSSNTIGGCSQQLFHTEDTQYPFHYVKHLLKSHDEGQRCSCYSGLGKSLEKYCSGKVGQLVKLVFQYICPYNRGLRLPLKFLGALFVMFIILYELSFVLFSGSLIAGTRLVDSWKDNGRDFLARLLNESESSTDVTTLYDDVLSVFRGIAAVIAIAPILAFALSFILLIHLAATVYKDLLKVARCGLESIYPKKVPAQATALVASLRYTGQQIGYFVWAWLIYWLISIGLGVLVLFVIFGLKFPFIRTSVAYVIGLVLVSLGWATTISFTQLFLCKFVFLEKSSGKFLIVTNKRLFNWLAYIMLFYNALIGLVGAFLRILFSAVFGMLLIFRVDRVVLMKGFEFFDFGHKTYLGFIYVEHTYNNPIVNAFVRLLQRDAKHPLSLHQNTDYVEASELIIGESSRNNAHKRWLVAYTLLRNPSLQGLTASRLLVEGKAHKAIENDETYKQGPKSFVSESGKEKEEVAGL